LQKMNKTHRRGLTLATLYAIITVAVIASYVTLYLAVCGAFTALILLASLVRCKNE